MEDRNQHFTRWPMLVILCILGLGLVFILLNLRPGPEINASQSSPYPGPQNQVIISPSVAAVKPLSCTFDQPPITNQQSAQPRENYTFSAPRVALTDTSILGIAGWLPDSKRLLLTKDTQDGFQEIVTYNIYSGDRQVYARRSISSSSSKPVWLNDLQAVAYASRSNPLQEAVVKEELRMSYGDPDQSELISPEIFGMSLSSDSRQLAYFSPLTGGQPQIWAEETKAVRAIPIDLAASMYPKYPQMIVLPAGRTLWTAVQLHGPAIAYYGAWLFLGHSTDNRLCEVELKPKNGGVLSVNQAQWSPDGRRLALIVGEFLGGTFYSDYLAILDINTGLITWPSMQDLSMIFDIAWSPDSQNVAVLGRITVEGQFSTNLFVGNIDQDTLPAITTDISLGSGRDGWQLAWSPDSHIIAVKCSVLNEDAICIIQSETPEPRWLIYERALAAAIIPNSETICEWGILGTQKHEVYVLAVCRDKRFLSAATVPAVIYLNDKREIVQVALPGSGNQYPENIRKLFPPDVQEMILTGKGLKFDKESAKKHLDIRLLDPTLPPLIAMDGAILP